MTSAQIKLEKMLLMLVSNSEPKNGNLFPRVVHEHFEGPIAPQRWGEKALNKSFLLLSLHCVASILIDALGYASSQRKSGGD